jgi:peptide-methionine (S)-S-oxide reductase
MPRSMQEIATLAGGCFWCLEAVYDEVTGVESVESGYIGGHKDNPTYYQVCSGNTGHAEAVQITFDPSAVSYRELLEIFFVIHDPTTLNRQGNDVGTQYRSAIYFHSPEQEATARAIIAELEAEHAFPGRIVTEVTAAPHFYIAEAEHQEYFVRNPHSGYCQFVVAGKVAKFRKTFAAKMKHPVAH